MDKKPKRIQSISEKERKSDFEKYRAMAIELKATDAKIIPADQVVVDFRVRAKCEIPKCPQFGTSAHCPPHSFEPAKMKEFVKAYKHALLVKLEVRSSTMTWEKLKSDGKSKKGDAAKRVTKLFKSYRKLTDIVTTIESRAFYDGYYLSTSLAAGACRAYMCGNQDCLVLKNEPCRHALRARPSMEACGIDVYKTVTEAGWDIYPIGVDCKPVDIPHGTLVGLVLID